jgi:hypothetical protein
MLGFEKREVPLADHLITGAETVFGISYPAAYRKTIKHFGGCYGSVDFRVDRSSPGFDYCNFGLILSLSPWDDGSIYEAVSNWREHGLHERLVPFGLDGGGNYVCFDYRGATDPEIVFYYHELHGDDGVMRVCPTYDAFLNRLEVRDD